MKEALLKVLLAAPPTEGPSDLQRALDLSGLPAEVERVGHADAVPARLAAGDHDCAVVDARLLDGTPLALIARLREEGITTPLILVVEEMDTAAGSALLLAGAHDCLTRVELATPRFAVSLLNAERARAPRATPAVMPGPPDPRLLRDPTTGLPNRALFLDRLERALSLATREGRTMALLLLDINQFSAVNRTMGFGIGDRLLRVTGERLQAALRYSDSLCRIGDDEFAALLPTGGSFPGAVTAANRLLDAMSQPFVMGEHPFFITAAVGVALHPQHGTDAETILGCAESALKHAKRNATGFAIYAGEDDPDPTRQLALTQDLRHALSNRELVVHYQPKIDLALGRVSGVEALVRWQHPRHGLIYPDGFIPLAEQIGVIDRMTLFVLDEAAAQIGRWREAGRELSVSVNLSALSLHDEQIALQIEEALAKWRLPPENLVLEITESAIIANVDRARATLTRLHDLGVRLSIDDFGTGYTSLAYLRRLPVSEIKIDKSFVIGMLTESDDAVIVRTIVELGRSLGLRVVAEGVENASTLDALKRLRCDEVQGYLVSRPLEAEALDAWLARSPWSSDLAATLVSLPTAPSRRPAGRKPH